MQELLVGPDGARIRWTEFAGTRADRPVRVFLHGLGASSLPYFAAVAAAGGTRSLLIDVLGHGLSDRPPTFAYTLPAHTGTVASILDDAGLAGCDVIGHSMGGSIAIVLAALRPDLVHRLVLIEPNLEPAEPEPGHSGSRGIAAYSEAEFLDHGFEAFLAAAGDAWRVTLRLTDPRALHRSASGLVAGSTPPMRELLSGLPIPRTHIAGSDGFPDDQTGLAEAGVRCVTVQGAGHNVMLDNQAGFMSELIRTLG